MNKKEIVVAITGASGVIYAARLLEVLTASECDVHLIISDSAFRIFETEMNIHTNHDHFDPKCLGISQSCISELFPSGQIIYHKSHDFTAPIASGSHKTAGMVICPCSMGTIGHLASGATMNLIHRAADVHLKERRKLILVPRETPFSLIHLENLTRLTQAGAVILPASPAFYHKPQGIADLVNFIVSRICDQLGVENNLIHRWNSKNDLSREAEPSDERFIEVT
ncbi:MAG: flavin prenyltransferase UbiX [Planctomycetia bacterium]|nr:flavin prenyltransferase UbiX [Planctomycetia bacterium]